MSIDVFIFTGGFATRLHGLWDGSKCLVPVAGRPLFDRLFVDCLAPLKPRRVVLGVGYLVEQVQWWLGRRFGGAPPFEVVFCKEPEPLGTAPALRHALMQDGLLRAPLLALNHDTLPGYDLGALVRFYEQRVGAWAAAAFTHDSERWRDIYAGAAVLSAAALAEICADERTRDFPAHLLGAQRFFVPGFLDVGTPEGFRKAQTITEEQLCSRQTLST